MSNAENPAFPAIENWRVDSGLTKREYFAAHAPEVPHYFERRMVPKFVVNIDDKLMQKKLVPESDEARMMRWRVFYADAMLAALRGEGGA